MNRGILSTAYCRLRRPDDAGSNCAPSIGTFTRTNDLSVCAEGDASPNPRHVRGANFCDINVFIDKRAGWVVTVAALDNLIKGAAGQALQAMNLMLGFPEETGLTAAGVFP